MRLSVCDEGLGIPADQLDHIFERYYQAHATSHRSGLGLGLSLSRKIVQRHGGRMWIEPAAGQGSRFVVELPGGRRARGVSIDAGHSLLVVEDDESIRNMIEMVIDSEGYAARTARNGAEALAALDQERPDLIFLDMKMPGMDGWEFARRYAAVPAPKPPVIVLTAAQDASRRAAEIGAPATSPSPSASTSLQVVDDHLLPPLA